MKNQKNQQNKRAIPHQWYPADTMKILYVKKSVWLIASTNIVTHQHNNLIAEEIRGCDRWAQFRLLLEFCKIPSHAVHDPVTTRFGK